MEQLTVEGRRLFGCSEPTLSCVQLLAVPLCVVMTTTGAIVKGAGQGGAEWSSIEQALLVVFELAK